MKTNGNKFAKALSTSIMDRQKTYLREAQETLGYGPTDMAQMLETNFNTYKAWLYGNNPMPGIAHVALDCVLKNLPEKK